MEDYEKIKIKLRFFLEEQMGEKVAGRKSCGRKSCGRKSCEALYEKSQFSVIYA